MLGSVLTGLKSGEREGEGGKEGERERVRDLPVMFYGTVNI